MNRWRFGLLRMVPVNAVIPFVNLSLVAIKDRQGLGREEQLMLSR